MLEIREEVNLEVVRQLWDVYIRHHKTHSRYFQETFDDENFEQLLEQIYACDDYRLEVVYLDDKALGFSVVMVCKTVGCIKALYIYDDLRGKGLGSYLMNRIILWLKTKDIADIHIDIFSGNEEAISFFKKLHFRTEKYTMKYMDKEVL